MLVFGDEQCVDTPEEMDEVSRWKYQRWKLAQLFPAMKPADFDAMDDSPWWLRSGFISISRYELTDLVNILNAQARAKRKPKTDL